MTEDGKKRGTELTVEEGGEEQEDIEGESSSLSFTGKHKQDLAQIKTETQTSSHSSSAAAVSRSSVLSSGSTSIPLASKPKSKKSKSKINEQHKETVVVPNGETYVLLVNACLSNRQYALARMLCTEATRTTHLDYGVGNAWEGVLHKLCAWSRSDEDENTRNDEDKIREKRQTLRKRKKQN